MRLDALPTARAGKNGTGPVIITVHGTNDALNHNAHARWACGRDRRRTLGGWLGRVPRRGLWARNPPNLVNSWRSFGQTARRRLSIRARHRPPL